MAFAQAAAVGAEDHRHVGEDRHLGGGRDLPQPLGAQERLGAGGHGQAEGHRQHGGQQAPLEEVEEEIACLEAASQNLEHALAQASVDQDLDRVRAFDVEYQRLQVDLDQLIAEWSALGEAVD